MKARNVLNQAVARRLDDYETTRDHVAKALFLKAKLRGGVTRQRHAVARLHYEARRAVRSGRDREAQRLLEEKALHREEIAQLEAELEHLENLVADLKNQLRSLLLETERLEREKLLSEVIQLSVPARTADDRALVRVRQDLEERLAERRLDVELSGRQPSLLESID